jgi:hypothetical protein
MLVALEVFSKCDPHPDRPQFPSFHATFSEFLATIEEKTDWTAVVPRSGNQLGPYI